MSRAAGAVIRDYLKAAQAGDWETAFGFYAADIVFRIPGRSRFAGEHRGRAAAIEYIETARGLAHAGEVTLELVDVLESRDRVALLVRETFRLEDRDVLIRRANICRCRTAGSPRSGSLRSTQLSPARTRAAAASKRSRPSSGATRTTGLVPLGVTQGASTVNSTPASRSRLSAIAARSLLASTAARHTPSSRG